MMQNKKLELLYLRFLQKDAIEKHRGEDKKRIIELFFMKMSLRLFLEKKKLLI